LIISFIPRKASTEAAPFRWWKKRAIGFFFQDELSMKLMITAFVKAID